jgi:hypothetical protein
MARIGICPECGRGMIRGQEVRGAYFCAGAHDVNPQTRCAQGGAWDDGDDGFIDVVDTNLEWLRDEAGQAGDAQMVADIDATREAYRDDVELADAQLATGRIAEALLKVAG